MSNSKYKAGVISAMQTLIEESGGKSKYFSSIAIKKIMHSTDTFDPESNTWMNAHFLGAVRGLVGCGDFEQNKSSYKLSASFGKKLKAKAKGKKIVKKRTKASSPVEKKPKKKRKTGEVEIKVVEDDEEDDESEYATAEVAQASEKEKKRSIYGKNRQLVVAKSKSKKQAPGVAENEVVGSIPGAGWTNGEIQNAMYPYTHKGKLEMFKNRRWIQSTSSWSRIGKGASSLDAVHSTSLSGKSTTTNKKEEATVIKCLISQLCQFFYHQGWATGTGGGCSIRVGGPEENRPWRVFVAASGIQKEDLTEDDIFELGMDQKIVQPPVTPNLCQSACTPLWYVVFRNRPSVKCVIHTHSMNALMATLLDPDEKADRVRITHLEMLKGVGNHAYDGILEVPIIDNRPSEDLLADQLDIAIKKFPKANAVLVRRHGIYCWGDSWEQAKTQCESFDYLFETIIKMRQMGIDYSALPPSGSYREERKSIDAGSIKAAEKSSASKLEIVVNGTNGMTNINNARDLILPDKAIPLLPKNRKILLLDIEGCTTAISFVKETLFPYVVSNIDSFLEKSSKENVEKHYNALIKDVGSIKEEDTKKTFDSFIDKCTGKNKDTSALKEFISDCVKQMVAKDIKATGLEFMQGDMWKSGYESGELKGHVYPDFKPMLEWCKTNNVLVSIYSSESINAQKLLFGNSDEGDLKAYFDSHFDTTSGGKKEKESYLNIANKLNVDPNDIVFVSDAEAELVAARDAGIGFPVMSIRPGNVLLTDVGHEFPIIYSLMQLCGS